MGFEGRILRKVGVGYAGNIKFCTASMEWQKPNGLKRQVEI
jgi:hypothetical protein